MQFTLRHDFWGLRIFKEHAVDQYKAIVESRLGVKAQDGQHFKHVDVDIILKPFLIIDLKNVLDFLS